MKMSEHIKRIKRRVGGLSLLPFYLFTFIPLYLSCSSIDCPVENVVGSIYYIKNADGTEATLKDSLSVVSWRKNRTDTLLLNKEAALTSFQLPMGYVNPEDTLVFIVNTTTHNAYKDTLYIKKENHTHFESVDCKIAYFHTVTALRLSSHNAIDSITIVKPEVNYDLSSEHFHIYFKTWD